MKFEVLAPVMDERMTRLWAAAEALGLGGLAETRPDDFHADWN